MRHARADYARIQDPAVYYPSLLSEGSTAIAADEPVFLLRAQDILAPEIVEQYADLLGAIGGSPHMITACRRWAQEIRLWQRTHDVAKIPDMPVTR